MASPLQRACLSFGSPMPSEITMPQLSDTMTEGTVVKWFKKEGDKVKEGEHIADVETDKATMEWEATDSGTLAVIVAKEGDKVKVGGAIAVLAKSGEDAGQVKREYKPGAATSAAAGPPEAASKSELETAGPGPIARGMEQARRELTQTAPMQTSEQLGQAATATASRGGNGAEAREGRIRITPLARRIAEERGIDPATIRGTGPGGRITQDD